MQQLIATQQETEAEHLKFAFATTIATIARLIPDSLTCPACSRHHRDSPS